MASTDPAIVGFELRHGWATRFPALAGGPLVLAVTLPEPEGLGALRRISVHPAAELVLYAHEALRLCVAKDALLGVLQAVAPGQLHEGRVALGAQRLSTRALVDARRLVGFVGGEELAGLACVHPLTREALAVALEEDEAVREAGALGEVDGGGVRAAREDVRARLREVGAWLAGT